MHEPQKRCPTEASVWAADDHAVRGAGTCAAGGSYSCDRDSGLTHVSPRFQIVGATLRQGRFCVRCSIQHSGEFVAKKRIALNDQGSPETPRLTHVAESRCGKQTNTYPVRAFNLLRMGVTNAMFPASTSSSALRRSPAPVTSTERSSCGKVHVVDVVISSARWDEIRAMPWIRLMRHQRVGPTHARELRFDTSFTTTGV